MLVKCVMNQHGFDRFLTVDKEYTVLSEDHGSYILISDSGGKGQFPKYLFKQAVPTMSPEVARLRQLVNSLLGYAVDGEWFHDHEELLEALGMTQEEYDDLYR